MFPQAHNPPRKRGTRAYAVVRQALWSHPVQRRISDGSTTAQRRISDGSTTAQRRISDGSTTAQRRISDGSTTAQRRIRACEPRNPADKGYEQSYRRRNCRRLRHTGGRVPYGGGDVAAPRLQETTRKRNLPVTRAVVITDLPPEYEGRDGMVPRGGKARKRPPPPPAAIFPIQPSFEQATPPTVEGP